MIDLVTKAKKILANNQYMTIATSTHEAIPWITPVYYAHDDSYTFFWYSGRGTKHSQLIAKNNHVSIVIFNPNANEEEAGGVYLEGKANEVTEGQLPHALETYFTKALPNDKTEREKMISMKEDFLGESVLRMYKFKPEKVYLSGDADKWHGKWIDSRIEVTLL